MRIYETTGEPMDSPVHFFVTSIIADQYAASLVIRTTCVCCNQMACERLAGNKGMLLRANGQPIISCPIYNGKGKISPIKSRKMKITFT